MFKVVVHARAGKNYERLPDQAVRRINSAFDALEQNPFFGPHIKRLHGPLAGCYRLRVGNYRIVYHIDEADDTVIIDALGGRGSVY